MGEKIEFIREREHNLRNAISQGNGRREVPDNPTIPSKTWTHPFPPPQCKHERAERVSALKLLSRGYYYSRQACLTPGHRAPVCGRRSVAEQQKRCLGTLPIIRGALAQQSRAIVLACCQSSEVEPQKRCLGTLPIFRGALAQQSCRSAAPARCRSPEARSLRRAAEAPPRHVADRQRRARSAEQQKGPASARRRSPEAR